MNRVRFTYRARICKPFKEPGIDSQPVGLVGQPYLSYRPARLHRLPESVPGLLKRLQIRAQYSKTGSCSSIKQL
jgi:hypothetical protein